MWIITDEAMRNILGGEFSGVLKARKENDKISMRKLFNYQFEYKSHAGFNDFYKKYIEANIDGLEYREDKSLMTKVVKFLSKK